jgi:hypothetical protein
MPLETLTYAARGARLKTSPQAARSLAKRLRLPRSPSDNGKALVSLDVAEIPHTPRSPGSCQADGVALLTAEIEELRAEITRLEARAAGHRANFERARECGGRLMIEPLRATAETTRPGRRWRGVKVRCGEVAELVARSTATGKLRAWGV